MHNLPFYGLAVLCGDDPVVQEIMPQVSRSVITYGLDASNDCFAHTVSQNGSELTFSVTRKNKPHDLKITLAMSGTHNVLNALAAIAVATDEGVTDEAIARGLSEFQGVGRRFQVYGEFDIDSSGSAMLVDDYGHHPKEVAVTIDGVRQGWPDRRLVMIYQPHRYTRTRDLYEDFVEVLSSVDQLILLDVFPAGEKKILGADGRSLARSIRNRGAIDPIFVEDIESVSDVVKTIVKAGDIVITQGAGSVSTLAAKLAKQKIIHS